MTVCAPIDTRIGRLWMVLTDVGLARLTLPGLTDRELADEMGGAFGTGRDPGLVAQVTAQVQAFLAGEPRPFTVPLDLRGVTGFRRRVLDAMATIPRGKVVSYAELAARAGSPRAVRAAGAGCATNPLPLAIPCHRVIRSDGTLGNYGGGVELKVDLLRMEGVAVAGTPPRAARDG